MTTSAVMLLGIVASQTTDANQNALSTAGLWRTVTDSCAVAQVHLAPAVRYSAADQGYVVSAIAFDEVPAECLGRGYHLALMAQDGSPIFETIGALSEDVHGVPIPDDARPRADAVATTVLSLLPDGAALPDGVSVDNAAIGF